MKDQGVCVHQEVSNKSKKLKKTTKRCKVNSPIVPIVPIVPKQGTSACIKQDSILQEKVNYPEKKVEETNDEISDFTSGITYSITQEMIKHFLNIIKESNNYNKIKNIIDDLTSTISNKVAPYLYSILAILIVMFFMNCFQFYYYLKSIGKKISSEI